MDSEQESLKRAPRMRLHLNVHEPIELVEMTIAFQGLGYEYQSFLKQRYAEQEEKVKTSDVKLYITKIESNCILAEMAPALPMLGALMPVLTDANTVHDFVKNVSSIIQWLISLGPKKSISPEDVIHGKRRINNVKDIVGLIAKNKVGELGLSAIRYEVSSGEDRAILEMRFSEEECKAAEKGARVALAALELREKADKEKVLMYFYQTNIEDPKTDGKTGDRAIISSISPEPLSVYVIPETDQQKVRYVLDDKNHNPLHTGFVVDVNIEHDRNGKPRIYRVVRVHEVIYDQGSA